jgi:hypothetical protein
MNKENLNIVFQNETFKFVLRGLILILGVVIVCLILSAKTEEKEVKTVVLHDTTVVHDTIIKTISKTQIEIEYKEIKITDTIFIDTSKIALPIEQKHYSDSLSDIWVSGYKPEIDSIKYHIPQQTIYIDKVVEIEKPKKWYEDRFIITAGVYGGYSPLYNNFDVIVGAGFSIRLN